MNKHVESEEADVRPLKSVSAIWFVPLVALLIGLWMVYYQWSTQGPVITIAFDTAQGMQAGKTKIKSRDVVIGEVSDISLNDKGDGVLITARMTKASSHFLVQDSEFWLVSPKISHTGVSGLSTLISGVYIEIAPGMATEQQTEFIARNDPPLTPAGAPGLHITLNSDDQFAYSKGDPIIYKGLTVGQFEDIYFNFAERVVYYNAFIKAPYHQLVTSNTKFWDVSGLRIDLKADGLSVKTGNLETMLTNGVTFDVPKGMAHGEQITERAFFDIYHNYEAADDERYRSATHFVVLVSDTIRGLNVGAPVEYRGVHIGQVISTNMLAGNAPDALFKQEIKIPVLISLQPGRVGLPDNDIGIKRMQEQNALWVKQGLKATLRTGNLLTGSLFVDLQHFDDQPVSQIKRYGDYPIIPTMTDEFGQITAKAGKFMDSLNHLPLDQLSGNANNLLLEITQTAKQLQGVSQTLDTLLNSANKEELSQQLAQTLDGITLLTRDLSAGSKGYEDLRKTLGALTDTLHELTPLLNQLKHQPNSLIFNSGQPDMIEPKKQ